MQKKIIKTLLWLLLITVVVIIDNIGIHSLEVFYMANVGPDQVNDYTTSYYWIDNYDNLKLGLYLISGVTMLFLSIRIFKIWRPKGAPVK